MSKIEELIQQLCPKGVEYKKIGDICVVKKGTQLNKNSLNEEGIYPVINGGINPSGYWNEYNFDANQITISQGGASAGYVNYLTTKFWAGAHCYVICDCSNSINYKYLYHFIKMQQSSFMQSQYGAGIPSLSLKVINDLSIPVPPLPIQEEIVRILDNFTNLKAELQAELQARKTQYEYYRAKLLNFSNLNGGGYEVRWVELKNVTHYSNTRIAAVELDKQTYIGVDNLLQNKQGKTFSSYVPSTGNMTRFETGDILIGNIRPYLKKIWCATYSGGTNGDVLVVRIQKENKNELNSKFLYYLLSSDLFFEYNMQFAKGAKMPRGDKSSIMKYKIPIPPIAEQERITGILDKFDALVNDLSVGLPAEIAARQKQYEYYRNMLLSFNELPNE